MQRLTIFHLNNCPYCHNAQRAVAELIDENPVYAGVPIEWIEETQQYALANSFDYYYVPSVYIGREKLYEARPFEKYEDCKANLKAALDTALAGE